jgi:hypothetical protein
MEEKVRPIVRPMHAWEIQEARLVFGDGLKYEKVRIHEGTAWPNTINRVGARVKRIPYVEVPNAITLGNHCFFPVRLLDQPVALDQPEYYKIPWLIHELTHTWQYQRLGWRYLAMALGAQFRYGVKAYEFGGEQGLLEALLKGWRLANFNLEQQGDIVRSYYTQVKKGLDASAWLPFITEIRKR